MRYPNSLFDRACQYINKIPVGQVFKTSDYTDEVGSYEKSTNWKQYSNNRFYVTMGYKTDLKHGGFITMVKRGVWKVTRHVPDWFDAGHLQFINGYGYDYKSNTRLTHYDGMTKLQIIGRLRGEWSPEETNYSDLRLEHVRELADKLKTDQTLRETYPANIEGSPEFNSAAVDSQALTDSYIRPVTIEKITKEESQFANQPKREVHTQEIVNLGLLRSAIASTDMITTTDSILHARVINAIAILADIEKSMSAKIDAQLFNGKL